MARFGLILSLALAIVWAGSAAAQPPRSPNADASPARRAGGTLPEVGKVIPEITLYDARGEEFSTTSLRGQYSVLVFGCLT